MTPTATRNRRSTSQSQSHPRRPLADILQDPDTEWADIQAALRIQGHGATTNAGVVKALQSALCPEESRRATGAPCCMLTSSNDDDDEGAGSCGKNLVEVANTVQCRDIIDKKGGIQPSVDANVSSLAGCDSTRIALTYSTPVIDNDDSVKNKGRGLPPRCMPKKRSSKGASFRTSLRNVLEYTETEADIEDDSTNLKDEKFVEAGGRGGHKNRRPKNKSIMMSVNLMDFGVSAFFSKSSLSLAEECDASSVFTTSDTSAQVDSEGFLPWNGGDDDDDDDPSSSSCGPDVATRRLSQLSESNSTSSLSHLVDDNGFLGWGERSRGESTSCDLDVNDAATMEDENAQDDHNESSETLDEIWNIEDYEDPDDMLDRSESGTDFNESKQSLFGIFLSEQMKRLSTTVTEGMSSKRNASNNNTDAPQEAINTNDIKNILLAGRSSDEPKETDGGPGPLHSSLNSFFRNRRASSATEAPLNSEGNTNKREVDGIKSFFSNRRRSTDDDCKLCPGNNNRDNDAFHSIFGNRRRRPDGPPEDEDIRINREDGIDIGELRRELVAGNNEGSTKKRGFFS